jgi:protein involved in polysaccharide export with SLBB domain
MRSAALLLAFVSLAAPVCSLWGQDAFRRTFREGFATRAELESLATRAERAASADSLPGDGRRANAATAYVLRQRLREGDFQPGDRIAVTLDGAVKLNDTLVVRGGRTISIPDLPDISLAGILRSELQTYLSAEIARYIRDPQLSTRPLVRLGISGGVTRPGFYSVPADALLSDLVMAAGGPAPNVAFGRSAIRRGGEELWNGGSVEIALSDGLTVDALLLRSGDELVVGEKRQMNWQGLVQTMAAVIGLVSVAVALKR